jgi:hypothetical protein
MWVCKDKLQNTIDEFNLVHEPLLVETIYQNDWLDPTATLIKSSWFRFATCKNDWDLERFPSILTVQNMHVLSNLDKIEKNFLR